MVKGPQHEQAISATVRKIQLANITNSTTSNGIFKLASKYPFHFFYLLFHKIEKVNFVTLQSEGTSIAPHNPTNVQDHGRRNRQVTTNDIKHPNELHLTESPHQTPIFIILTIKVSYWFHDTLPFNHKTTHNLKLSQSTNIQARCHLLRIYHHSLPDWGCLQKVVSRRNATPSLPQYPINSMASHLKTTFQKQPQSGSEWW